MLLQRINLGLVGCLHDGNIAKLCEVGTKMDAQRIALPVGRIENLRHTSYEKARRKYRAIAARLDDVAFLDFRVARNIVERSIAVVVALPRERAEIVFSAHAAAQVRLVVRQRDNKGVVLLAKIHDAHDALPVPERAAS